MQGEGSGRGGRFQVGGTGGRFLAEVGGRGIGEGNYEDYGSARFGGAGGEETVRSIAKVDVVRGFRFQQVGSGNVTGQKQYGEYLQYQYENSGRFRQGIGRGNDDQHRKPYDQLQKENLEVIKNNSQLLSENVGVRQENSALVDENKELKWQLKVLRRKYVNDSNQAKIEMVNLRSEQVRMSEECQIEMGKVIASEKKWRLKVKKMQQQPFLTERLERSSSILGPDHPSSVEKKETVQSCDELKKRKTSRQVQIELLEAENDLCEYEKAKLQTLIEQEQAWNELDMEEVINEMREPEEVSKKSRKSRSKSAPAPISERATRSKLAKPNRSTSDDPLTHLACENSEVDSVCNIPGAKLQSKEVIKESNYGDPDAKACDTEEEYEEGDGIWSFSLLKRNS